MRVPSKRILMRETRDAHSNELVSTAIESAPEFRRLCTCVEQFVRDDAGALEMRTAVHLFADAARQHAWSPEGILKALHATPCYPRDVGGTVNQPASKRYYQALDFLLDDYFNVIGAPPASPRLVEDAPAQSTPQRPPT